MTRSNPYHIKVTADEIDDFMGRDRADAKPAPTATPNQAADAFTRWPGWGPVPGLNAFGPTATWTATTTATVGRRAWPTLVIIALVVLGVGSLLVALRMRTSEPTATYAPPAMQVAAPATPAPVATPAPTLAPAPVAVTLGEPVPPVMVVYCDGAAYPLRSLRQLVALVRWRGASWPRGCHTDTDWWSEARQYEWQRAHPREE